MGRPSARFVRPELPGSGLQHQQHGCHGIDSRHLFPRETVVATASPWGQAVEAGRKVSETKGLFEVLLYDPKLLHDATAAVRVAEGHLGRLQMDLAEQDRHQSVEGDRSNWKRRCSRRWILLRDC